MGCVFGYRGACVYQGYEVEAVLAAHVDERLAPYKRLAEFLLREALPLTAAGKLCKQALKSELED